MFCCADACLQYQYSDVEMGGIESDGADDEDAAEPFRAEGEEPGVVLEEGDGGRGDLAGEGLVPGGVDGAGGAGGAVELVELGLEVEDAAVWFEGSGTGSRGSGDVLGEGVAEDEDTDSSVNKSESISEC